MRGGVAVQSGVRRHHVVAVSSTVQKVVVVPVGGGGEARLDGRRRPLVDEFDVLVERGVGGRAPQRSGRRRARDARFFDLGVRTTRQRLDVAWRLWRRCLGDVVVVEKGRPPSSTTTRTRRVEQQRRGVVVDLTRRRKTVRGVVVRRGSRARLDFRAPRETSPPPAVGDVVLRLGRLVQHEARDGNRVADGLQSRDSVAEDGDREEHDEDVLEHRDDLERHGAGGFDDEKDEQVEHEAHRAGEHVEEWSVRHSRDAVGEQAVFLGRLENERAHGET
mmetsp:Transcript_3133/g.11964  ORF Transcript_3133/g.11964 Transcript_3133/m.11964 type:complete len:276 (+) Transcript_3133:320-1147(+)